MPSPWGDTLILVSDQGIRAVLPGFANDWDAVQKRARARFVQQTPQLATIVTDVAAVFANPMRKPVTPLDPKGTEFQFLVWQALGRTRPGERVTYTELARQIDRPGAQRAVAGACAANPIAVLVPCHRVVPSKGGLGGYRWGTRMKEELLELESGSPRDSE